MHICQHMYWAVNSADVKAISSLLLIIWWAGRVDHCSFARTALAICIITPFPPQHLSIQISICLIFKVLPNVTFMLRTWTCIHSFFLWSLHASLMNYFSGRSLYDQWVLLVVGITLCKNSDLRSCFVGFVFFSLFFCCFPKWISGNHPQRVWQVYTADSARIRLGIGIIYMQISPGVLPCSKYSQHFTRLWVSYQYFPSNCILTSNVAKPIMFVG